MRVLLFGHLKKVAGVCELALPANQPMTVDQFWHHLLALHPCLSAYRDVVRVSCNLEFANAETIFRPEDEAALLPPVSGG